MPIAPADGTANDLIKSAILVLVTGGVGWILGGKQKEKREATQAEATSGSALVNAATAGFTASMTSNTQILAEYMKVATRLVEIEGTLSDVKHELKIVKEVAEHNSAELVLFKKKNTFLAGVVITREQEIRDKDEVIESLILVISDMQNGKETPEAIGFKIERIVNSFTAKYRNQEKDPLDDILRITAGAASIEIAAELLDDKLTDYIKERHSANETTNKPN